ncbi:Transposon TX1 uncharacterized 149 kDa protein [Linum perenne]
MEKYRDEAVIREEKLLLHKLDLAWRSEEAFWGQRARVNWLHCGDRNTKFFHATTTQRKLRNSITKLKREDGGWIEEETEIKDHITTYFKKLFTAPDRNVDYNLVNEIPRVVTNEMNEELTQSISDEEVKKAVFDMGKDKAPGPDGYSGHFYRKYWNVIGPQLCQEVKEFFRNTTMPTGWNETHIVIIPKIPNPEEIGQFRPISCCNFNYKIISKIMASRLKKWIPHIISEMQTAFTAGRAIQDNIMIVHEVIHHFKKRAGKYQWDMMIKLDMKKAYDMVDWEGLDKIMRVMGFSDMWCNWINECIRTVQFSVMVNGAPTDNFKPSRGIRQGDPMSPFLFIILTNTLSFLIEKGISHGSLKGLKLNRRCPTLTHVLFADDTILFGDASVAEAMHIQKTMETYANITGQSINTQKSAIMFTRHTPQALKDLIAHGLGIPCSPDFGKYLGVPSEWGGPKKDVFKYLLSKMEALGESWKSQCMSHGGKEVLLKAVYQSIPTYIMSCFLLPKDLTNKMNMRLRAFFWGGSMTKKTIHWTNGDTLTKPKWEGGLGFKDFHTFNLALLAKQGWRLTQNGDQLWARLLKGMYFKDKDFLQASKGSCPSWIWSSLCDSRTILRRGMRKNMINGMSIEVVKDPWVPTLPNFRIISTTPENTLAEQWLTDDKSEWNRELVSAMCTADEANAILKIPVGPPQVDDHWIWHFERRGKFTVKSAYNELKKSREAAPGRSQRRWPADMWKWLWRVPVPPKFTFFIWRAINDALATKKNLNIRRCSPSPRCPLCLERDETVIHCLFQCKETTDAWRRTLPRLTLPFDGDELFEWIFKCGKELQVVQTTLIFSMMWSIWRARNEFIFRDVAPNTENICFFAERTAADWNLLGVSSPFNGSERPHSSPILVPRPPPVEQVHHEIFCDGSFDPITGAAGYGVIIKNTHGQVTDGKAGMTECSSALVAEAKALLVALRVAETLNGHSRIKSDCLTLIDALRHDITSWPWECYAWLLIMKDILLAHDRISLAFIPRRLNTHADLVAKAARSDTLPYNWLSNFLM